MELKFIFFIAILMGSIILFSGVLSGIEETPPAIWNNKPGKILFNQSANWFFLDIVGKNNGSVGFNKNTGIIGFAKEGEFIGEIIPIVVAQSPLDGNYYLCPIINPNVNSQSTSGNDITRRLEYSGSKELTCYEYDNYGNSVNTNLIINKMEISCNNKGSCKLSSNVTFEDFTPLDSGFGYFFVPRNITQFRFITYENKTIDLLNVGKISNANYNLALKYIDNTTISLWEWEDMLTPETFINISDIKIHFEVVEFGGKKGLLTGTYGYGGIRNIVVDPTQNWDSGTICEFGNSTCWASGTVPVAGDDIVFNGTGTGDVNITNNTLPQDLASWTVTSDYTGSIHFMPMFGVGDWGVNALGTQEWNVTNNINVSGGFSFVYGDYLLDPAGTYNLTEDGHGAIWRSLNGNITIGTSAVLDGIGLGFSSTVGPGSLGATTHGGSHGGIGDAAAFQKDPYGNATAPTSLGSGGSVGNAGSAIKLEATTLIIIDGNITVNGEGSQRTGSGGSIWIIADNITGAGRLLAEGGEGSDTFVGAGGRIRLEYGSYLEYTGFISLLSPGRTTPRHSTGTGILTFTNNTWPGDWILNGSIGLLGGDYGEGNVTNIQGDFILGNGYNITVYGDCFNNKTNTNLCFNTTSDGRGVWINASGNITINSGSVIEGLDTGFPLEVGPGFSAVTSGGTYGGKGGANTLDTYGSETQPLSLGSGGSEAPAGGAIKLESQDRIIFNGIANVTARDTGANNRMGSGGSIWLMANNISGNGTLTATGGNSGSDRSGGGGRISLTSSGVVEFLGNIFNKGGNGTSLDGGGGTVFINATTHIITSMNITTIGFNGGNITFIDTLLDLSGVYNATNLTGGSTFETIITNYTGCASTFPGTFNPSRTDQNDSVNCGVDSCTYTSGNYNVTCSDNCVITSDIDVDDGGNISLIGTGTFTINDAISITGFNRVQSDRTCLIKTFGSGGFFQF